LICNSPFDQGGIGKALVKKVQPWDLKIVYYNRNRLPEYVEKEYNATYVSLDDLLAQSDIVSLHTPLTADTKYLLDTPQFNKMKKNAILINTARGPVVNEKALVEALNEGKIMAAGLDVFENEPSIEPGLLQHPRVTILPHIGTATKETRGKMWVRTGDIILEIVLYILLQHCSRRSIDRLLQCCNRIQYNLHFLCVNLVEIYLDMSN
jgi:lactate dehydrogenase-like 2-hydroxyacid dehydrogenase